MQPLFRSKAFCMPLGYSIPQVISAFITFSMYWDSASNLLFHQYCHTELSDGNGYHPMNISVYTKQKSANATASLTSESFCSNHPGNTTGIMPTFLLYLPESHLSPLCISLSLLSNAGCLLSYTGIRNSSLYALKGGR